MPELDKRSAAPLSPEISPQAAPPPLEFPIPRPPQIEELDREVLLRLQERSLRFLVRGVVHRMNNLLAVFSSHAQLLKIRADQTRQEGRIRAPGEREVHHLLQTVDQGDSAMILIGSLLRLPGVRAERLHPLNGTEKLKGDPREASGVSLGSFLRSLEDVLLCETQGQRFPVRIHAELQVYSSIAPSSLLLVVCLLLEHLQECVPTDLPGFLDLDIRDDVEGPTLVISFERNSEQLPFPVIPGELDSDLAHYMQVLGIKLHGLPGRPAYELVLPVLT